MLNKLTLYISVIVPLAGAMTACSSDSHDADLLGQGGDVSFIAREASRATLISNDNLRSFDFAVYGDRVLTASASTSSPTAIFNGTKVSYRDGSWQYTGKQYWFPDYTYSFVAICPATPNEARGINYQNSQLSFTYTYPADYSYVTDVMIANHTRRYTLPVTGTTSSPVTFDFRHLLARVKFVGHVNSAITSQVTIHSISIEGLYGEATYTLKPASVTQSNPSTYDSETDEWTTDLTATPDLSIAKTLAGNSATITPGSSATIFDDDDILLVLPQKLPIDAKVTIKYSIDSNDYTSSADLYAIASLTHAGEWKSAMRYTYNFTIGVNDYMIFQQPEITTWYKSEGGNYIIAD